MIFFYDYYIYTRVNDHSKYLVLIFFIFPHVNFSPPLFSNFNTRVLCNINLIGLYG